MNILSNIITFILLILAVVILIDNLRLQYFAHKGILVF